MNDCEKVAYASPAAVKRAMRAIRRRGRPKQPIPYRCRDCHSWHVASGGSAGGGRRGGQR